MFDKNTPKQLPLTEVLIVDVEAANLTARYDATVPVYCVVIMSVTAEKKVLTRYFDANKAIERVQAALDEGWFVVMHSAKFDYSVLSVRGLVHQITAGVLSIGCTQIMSYARDTSKRNHSLDALTGQKMNVRQAFADTILAGELLSEAEFWARDWSKNSEALGILADYCAQDVRATWNLYRHLADYYNKQAADMIPRLAWLEFPMIQVLSSMEIGGAYIDKELLFSTIEQATATKESLENQIRETAGLLPKLKWTGSKYEPIVTEYKHRKPPADPSEPPVYNNKLNLVNHYTIDGVPVTAWEGHKSGDAKDGTVIGNHCQLVPYNPSPATGHSWWLIRKLCPDVLEQMNSTKSGKPQVNKDFFSDVAELLPQELPIAKLAQVSKQLTMCEGVLKFVSADGRIHGNYMNCSTRTGRLSTNNPNLQNISRPGTEIEGVDYGKQLRSMFAAPAGKKILVADLDSIELGVLAWFLLVVEKDSNMSSVINEGKSPHDINAATWGLARIIAKTLIFTLVYGGQAQTVYRRKIASSMEEAEEMVASVEEKQPTIGRLKRKVWAKIKQRGYASNPFAARGYYPELNGSKWQIARGERQSFNWLIQATARDIMHLLTIASMDVVYKYGARFINLIHDELVLECDEDKAEELKRELNTIWNNRRDILPGIRINGEWNIGAHWYEAK